MDVPKSVVPAAKRPPGRHGFGRESPAARAAGVLTRLETRLSYRLLFEENPLPMWVVDARTRSVLAVNRAAAGLFGCPPALAPGLKIATPGPDATRARGPRAIDVGLPAPALPRPARREIVRQRSRDGASIDVEVAWSPIDVRGRRAYLGVANDVAGRSRREKERARLLAGERAARGAAEEALVRMQVLSRRLVELREAERRSIARELHDQFGQLLTGLRLLLAAGWDGTKKEARRRRDRMLRIVDDLLSRVRSLSMDLRPAMLDELGLLPALLWNFERYSALTGVRVAFVHSGLRRRFRPDVETAAFRIVQEALTNVARHAGVASVSVEVRAGRRAFRIRVEDSGRGFLPDAALAGPSSGLPGMRERARLLGGCLRIDSRPGGGCRIEADIPLAGAPAPAAAGRNR